MSGLCIHVIIILLYLSLNSFSSATSQAKPEVCSDNYSDKDVDECLIIVENCVVLWMDSIKFDWQLKDQVYTETIKPKTSKPEVTSTCNVQESTSGRAVSSNLTLSFKNGLTNASSLELDFVITANTADRYWIVDGASLKINNGDKVFNLKTTDLTAADTFSFSCSFANIQNLKSSKDTTTDYATVGISRLQLQPFKSKNANQHFTDSYDCATWFTISTMMGISAPLLFISLVAFGVYMLSSRSFEHFFSHVNFFKKIIQHQTIKYDIVPLTPLSKHRLSLVKRKILVLDLDETLIHSTHDGVLRQTINPCAPADFVLKVVIDRHPVRFFVLKRPHVDYFLEVVSQWYELVVFTASMEIYGAAVADKLDNNRNILKRRYFRQHCTLEYGSYTKDLSAISPDLSSIFILDNSPGAYRAFPNNAIPINSWFSDPRDTALLNLLPVLDALRFTSDVRSVLNRNLHLHNMW